MQDGHLLRVRMNHVCQNFKVDITKYYRLDKTVHGRDLLIMISTREWVMGGAS